MRGEIHFENFFDKSLQFLVVLRYTSKFMSDVSLLKFQEFHFLFIQGVQYLQWINTDNYIIILMNFETLQQENHQLKKALGESKLLIQKSFMDYQTLQSIHDELRNENDRLVQTLHDLSQKQSLQQNEFKQDEMVYRQTIGNLKQQIEMKQREMEEFDKNQLNFDHDMLRIKLMNELEQNHQQVIDQKEDQIKTLQQQINQIENQFQLDLQKEKIKFQNDLEKYQFNIQKKDNEIQILNHKLDDQLKIIDSQDNQEQIRSLKRQLNELEKKLEIQLQEYESQSIELLEQKENQISIKIQYEKKLEDEKQKYQRYRIENDKMSTYSQALELENQKMTQTIQQKNSQIEKIDKDVSHFQEELHKKENQVNLMTQNIHELQKEMSHKQLNFEKENLKIYEQHRNEVISLSSFQMREIKKISSYKKIKTQPKKFMTLKIVSITRLTKRNNQCKNHKS